MTDLKELRVRQALSIRDLAKKAGVSPRTIVQIEAERLTPRFSTMRKIAGALGVTPADVAEFSQAMDQALGELAA